MQGSEPQSLDQEADIPGISADPAFPLFFELASELRDQIWHYIADVPRNLDTWA